MTIGKTTRERGFTLLEMLLALAVGLLFMASLTEIVMTVKQGWLRAQTDESRFHQETLAITLLDRLLTGALPPNKTQTIQFSGTTRSLTFSTLPSVSTQGLGAMKSRLMLSSQADGLFSLDLIIAAKSTLLAVLLPIPEKRTLLTGIKNIEFTYFARALPPFHPVSEWHNSNRLPDLIKIKISFAEPKRAPLRIVAQPRQTVDNSCLNMTLRANCGSL